MKNTLITRSLLPGFLMISSALLSSQAIADGHSSPEQRGSLEQRITALESKIAPVGESWYDNLDVSGLIEVEIGYTDPESGDSSSDLVVATAALGVEATLTENLSAALALLNEEDDTDLEVDIATIAYTQSDGGLSFTLGQDYLPFGNYSTALINDPLTLELGETRETALVANYEAGVLAGTFYLFNGEQDEDGRDQLTNFGARIAFASDSLSLGVDYISNLGDSDSLEEGDYGASVGEEIVDGASIHGELSLELLQLSVEHLSALDKFAVDGNDSEPSATKIEIAYGAGDFTYAIAYQETDEAQFLALPEERISAGLSTKILGGVGLALELVRDEDYAIADGGTGEYTDSIVFQFAAEF